jgi:Zn-dependent protease
MLGRLSLNPLRHIDPIGTVILPIVAGILTNFNFVLGYAKPVPITWNQLRNPKRDMILVALAGPFSNFIMAFLWAGLFKIAILLHPEASAPVLFLLMTSRAGMLINLVLAFLNLIPLPPLDGSRVITSLLPPDKAMVYAKIEPYGFIILVILIFTGALGYILTPLIYGGMAALRMIFQL